MSKTYERLQSLNRGPAPPPPTGAGNVSPAVEETVRRSGRGRRAYIVILIVAAATIGLALTLPYILPSSSGMRVIPRGERARHRRDRPRRTTEKTVIFEAKVPDRGVHPPLKPATTKAPADAKPPSDDAFLVTPQIVTGSAAGEALAIGTATPGGKEPGQELVAVNVGKAKGDAPVRRARPDKPDAGAGRKDKPPEYVTNFQRGVSLQEAGQLQEAIRYYEKVLIETPGHAPTLCNLGIIYQGLKEYDKAVENFSRAIAANPSNYHGYNNLGSCHILRGRYDKAVVALRKSLKLAPDNYSSLCNLGVALTGLRTYDIGERALMRAIALDPGRVRAFYNLGNLYRHWEQPRKALHFYRLFIEKSRGRYPQWERVAKRHMKRLERMERMGAKP